MSIETLPASLTQTLSKHILGDLSIEIRIDRNPLAIPPEALFSMAARQNKKRGFLFVSKVLGKHIPVHPLTPLLGSGALAGCYAEAVLGDSTILKQCDFSRAFTDPAVRQAAWEEICAQRIRLSRPTLFIGFAETATALGHGVFACFDGPARYIHTTREELPGLTDALYFQEEHCHAPEHRCYSRDPEFFDTDSDVVLVDDEITTGKSALNFIRAIQSRYPRQRYTILALLDWRSELDRQRFTEAAQELGIQLEVHALLSGRIEVDGRPVEAAASSPAAAVCASRLPQTSAVFLDEFVGPVIACSSQNSGAEINDTPYLAATGRFGMTVREQNLFQQQAERVGRVLREKRQGARTLCLGHGEFMYIPFCIASHMGAGVVVQSTTRSPVHPAKRVGYAVQHACSFPCVEDEAIPNFVYNIPPGVYDEVFLFLEREVTADKLQPLLRCLGAAAVERVCIVVGVSNKAGKQLPQPQPMGSYSSKDVTFLLKDIGGLVAETALEDREEAIQGGRHYSEMLPQEYQPTADYMNLFHETLAQTAQKVALAAGIVAEQIWRGKGRSVVLVSLARAGTPVGILIKRYVKAIYGLDLPHYSISIIRGKGIDENALRYILRQHPGAALQFIDGWTGKGAITRQLIEACEKFSAEYGQPLQPDLAVLADPGCCTSLYGTREDYLIPSACLNSTVSGLLSRTVHRTDLIGPHDFHGAKFYSQWQDQDVSQLFIDTVAAYFPAIASQASALALSKMTMTERPEWTGLKTIREIQQRFGIDDINLVKPGVGETTRVLLRRVPWKILVDSVQNPDLRHIFLLAGDRNVPVEEYPGMSYACCGLIKPLGGN